jgi:hypothetical protein
MQNSSNRKWWQLRRVQWPAGALLTLTLAAALAIARSGASRVVVYNDSGESIPELTVSACGQSRTFQNVSHRSSIRLKLAATGSESEIAISTNGGLMWRGDYIEPRGGYRAIVRLRSDSQVGSFITVSAWQRLLHPRPENSF